jgi:hypothetical protein
MIFFSFLILSYLNDDVAKQKVAKLINCDSDEKGENSKINDPLEIKRCEQD